MEESEFVRCEDMDVRDVVSVTEMDGCGAGADILGLSV